MIFFVLKPELETEKLTLVHLTSCEKMLTL
jgi:hypothetical protein